MIVHPQPVSPREPAREHSLSTPQLGVVSIGRNEGDRLVRCLDSLQAQLAANVPVIYVDSGSTDNSLNEAQQRGAKALVLDMSIPFTAARARNAGFTALMKIAPDTDFVQFIDSDCELLAGWIDAATRTLLNSPDTAIVFGRLSERSPNASIYNQLANEEWRAPIGEVKSCGGIALVRSQALQAVNGYNPQLICGEEPEMCIRLRRLGWKIRCIDVPMATHDIDMHHFSEWWKRSIRAGWAVAQGAAMYGKAPEKFKYTQQISGWVWGAVMPLLALAFVVPTKGLSVLTLLALCGLQTFKVYRNRQKTHSPENALLYAVFCTLSKVPQAIGQGRYWLVRWRKQPAKIIEYKKGA